MTEGHPPGVGSGSGFGIAAFTGSEWGGRAVTHRAVTHRVPVIFSIPRHPRDALARLALRRTCEAGTVAEELAVVARTAHAAVSAVSAARIVRERTGTSGVRTRAGDDDGDRGGGGGGGDSGGEGGRETRAAFSRQRGALRSRARGQNLRRALPLLQSLLEERRTRSRRRETKRRRARRDSRVAGGERLRQGRDGIALAAGFDTESCGTRPVPSSRIRSRRARRAFIFYFRMGN